jgi:hypothetical protein
MRIVCGLDVHKDSVFVCILNEKGEKFEAKYGVFVYVKTKYYPHRLLHFETKSS